MNFWNIRLVRRAIRMMLQAGGRAGCDLCLAISPSGCFGLACGISLKPQAIVAEGERDDIRPFVCRERPPRHDDVTADFVDKPKRTGFVLQDRKQVSCGDH